MQPTPWKRCFPGIYQDSKFIFSLSSCFTSSHRQEEDTPPPTPQNKPTKVPPETKPKPVTPPPVTAPPAVGEDEDDGDKIMAELQVRSASARHSHVHTHRQPNTMRSPSSSLGTSSFFIWVPNCPLCVCVCVLLGPQGEDPQPSSSSLQYSSPRSSSSPGLVSQVFQKCTVKDVEGSLEPATRIEPQIRELRLGALLPLKDKKVKMASPLPCRHPANRPPLPAVCSE